ncbi:basic proline-rich protein-like [Hyaena hyaena]|uniref:basic proline-rich protein-like n=1 Tax=Hyaena hyaena TaxID=95912 RepID=UPI00192079AC|nr:basic proline-rich protein-like [Hyaena hyaena]
MPAFQMLEPITLSSFTICRLPAATTTWHGELFQRPRCSNPSPPSLPASQRAPRNQPAKEGPPVGSLPKSLQPPGRLLSVSSSLFHFCHSGPRPGRRLDPAHSVRVAATPGPSGRLGEEKRGAAVAGSRPFSQPGSSGPQSSLTSDPNASNPQARHFPSRFKRAGAQRRVRSRVSSPWLGRAFVSKRASSSPPWALPPRGRLGPQGAGLAGSCRLPHKGPGDPGPPAQRSAEPPPQARGPRGPSLPLGRPSAGAPHEFGMPPSGRAKSPPSRFSLCDSSTVGARKHPVPGSSTVVPVGHRTGSLRRVTC